MTDFYLILACIIFTSALKVQCGIGLKQRESSGTQGISGYLGGAKPHYVYDLGAIRKFFRNANMSPISSHSGKILNCCRHIQWTSAGRFHNLMNPWVYDCVAEDNESGISVLVSHSYSIRESREAAVDALMYHLRLLDLIKDARCTVHHYSPLLQNIKGNCDSGTAVRCNTVCKFACANKNSRLIGNSALTCCENGTFSSRFPSCEVTDSTSKRRVIEDAALETTKAAHVPASHHHSMKQSQEGYMYLIDVAVIAAGILIIIGVASWVKHLRRRKKCTFGGGEKGITSHSFGYYPQYTIRRATPTKGQLDPSENYIMSGTRKGSIFILNNNNFSHELLRRGSYIDAKNISHVFREIGYKPHLETNLTSQEIKRKLVELKCGIDSHDTSVILFFMTRGDQNGIHGVDGNMINVEDIKDMFSSRGCPALQDKPKIIFIQTIRSRVLASQLSDDGILQGNAAFVRKTSSSDINRDPRLNCETDAFQIRNDDIFAVQTELDGYSSMRLPANGSSFIQVLCEELILKAHEEHLDAIMTGVTRRIAAIRGVELPQITKQGICKRIFFLPKYAPPCGMEADYFEDDEDQ